MKGEEYIDVFIIDKQYRKTPARQQQFVDIRTDKVLTPEQLEGCIIIKVFIDTFGRQCMTLRNPHYKEGLG